jgi:TPR repeat protein
MPTNIPKAITYFERGMNDSRSLNALGYIYYEAPDFLESDPVQLSMFGKTKKNLKLAKEYFTKAASLGNVNAYYNLGCIHLTSNGKDPFSFS